MRHHAEGVRRADMRVKSACVCAVSLKIPCKGHSDIPDMPTIKFNTQGIEA